MKASWSFGNKYVRYGCDVGPDGDSVVTECVRNTGWRLVGIVVIDMLDMGVLRGTYSMWIGWSPSPQPTYPLNSSSLNTTYYPHLPKSKHILREGFHILSSDPTTQSFLKTKHCQLLQITQLLQKLSTPVYDLVPSQPWKGSFHWNHICFITYLINILPYISLALTQTFPII